MTVYVLSQLDSYDRSEVLGVYATAGAARSAAETADPGQFEWRPMDGGFFASYRTFDGPTYSYSVESFEVQS